MFGGIPGAGGDGSALVDVDAFSSLRAVVVGEAMLDVYLRGSVGRLSPDGPFPVVDSPVREAAMGGAANVAANVAALGAAVGLVSAVGRDPAGSELARLAARHGVDVEGVCQDLMRRTLTKTRVVGEGLPLVRVDEGSTHPPKAGTRGRLLSHLRRQAVRADVLVVSDYRYGVVDDEMIAWLSEVPRRPLTVVDSKNLGRFSVCHPDAVTSNYGEVQALLDIPPETGERRVEQLCGRGKDLRAVTGADVVAVTLDRDGVVLVGPDAVGRHLPAMATTVEPCGAGDTFTATMAMALAAGAGPVEAAVVAQRAAAVVIDKPGTAVCSAQELHPSPAGKWCEVDSLVRLVQRHRSAGQSIVFTNGCFDVLHAGHVASLEEAASLGDVLVVAVNGDAGVGRLKGPGRPVNPLADRMAVLAGLSMVDYLVAFDDESPIELLRRLRPDVYCKGGDYRGRWIPEMELVRSWNGRTHYTSLVPDHSTTATVERIQSNGGAAVRTLG